MSNKKLYMAEEAAHWNLGDIPNDLSDKVESSGSHDDDDFVPDALGFSNPIADKSGDEGDEDVAEVVEEDEGDEDVAEVVEEDESSEYTESSSDEEVEADALSAASTVDTNITDTNPNYVFRGNVDINIKHFDVEQDRHWDKKGKNQIDTLFASPEDKTWVLISLLCHETNKLGKAD